MDRRIDHAMAIEEGLRRAFKRTHEGRSRPDPRLLYVGMIVIHPQYTKTFKLIAMEGDSAVISGWPDGDRTKPPQELRVPLKSIVGADLVKDETLRAYMGFPEDRGPDA